MGGFPGLAGFWGFCFLLLMKFGEVLSGGLGLFWYLSGLKVFFGTLQAMLLSDLCTVKDEGLFHELLVMKRVQFLLGFRL